MERKKKIRLERRMDMWPLDVPRKIREKREAKRKLFLETCSKLKEHFRKVFEHYRNIYYGDEGCFFTFGAYNGKKIIDMKAKKYSRYSCSSCDKRMFIVTPIAEEDCGHVVELPTVIICPCCDNVHTTMKLPNLYDI